MNRIAIIASTDRGVTLGLIVQKEFQKSALVSTRSSTKTEVQSITSIADFLQTSFHSFDAFIFIGALGICVRSVAPYIQDKKEDPAIVNIDDHGKFAQSVLSGHIGGANELTHKIAAITGAQAVITTSSDIQNIWHLDTISNQFGWKIRTTSSLTTLISLFVNNKPTAVLLDIKDPGTTYLEKNKPDFVDFYYDYLQIDFSQYELFIAVTYKIYNSSLPTLLYHPQVLHVGMGCSRGIETHLLEESFRNQLLQHKIAIESIKSLGSIDIKYDEEAFIQLAQNLEIPFVTWTADQLNTQQVKNPSETVREKLGVDSVSEASAMLSARNQDLLLEKQKITVSSGKKYTLALTLDKTVQRKAMIAIVGAGPGDPELISVKGKQLLEQADLILYAGSLVPEELLTYAKPDTIIRNSASMNLEEQIELMVAYYTQGKMIVRLHSGDPSIYGAIQEQISIFEERGMDYFIVPGISAFQAAAAYLKSEFTIPEVVQTIILTRGEGNTPLPEHEKLNEMARHKATMCIFLSATIAKTVQAQLLEHYSEDTPIAILYRVTWKDEEVYTGTLNELAAIIREHKLTRTVLIIVGVAIGARQNRSQLYHPEHKHIFRTGKPVKL
ncbi:precorrin-4 C(11)-methyltransferase [Xanthocytophaga agilis]|uniref:Precorrin-4 C(11)-methyltransferase n=1 Tax=Xanthocytophaga agilis TaxID=3048010 RepID=A0AAE3QVY0_9BACT|nr:precorrin-4 C(11)-methyltransferase [Xanthocytophaga agilis]MDJ1499031.1 precorrin-4 C(11)-methyltransferase [Xanthocytophaga agilis]